MRKRLSNAVIVAAMSMAAHAIPAHAESIDLQLGSGFQYFAFGESGSVLPTFLFSLSKPGTFTIADAYLSGDQFRINITSSAGMTVFSGLTSTPSIGLSTGDPAYALQNPAFSSASVSLSAGTYAATGTVEASPYGSGGAFAGLFESDSSSGGGGGSGGAPAPEINAILGLALAGGTVAFLRRRRGERSEPAVA